MDNGRAKIENTNQGLLISIPSKKNWFVLAFMAAWLGGWYFGFKMALGNIDFNNLGGDNFMLFWLIGWTIGGLFVISVLLWGFFGKETLEFDSTQLIFNKTVLGFNIISKKLNRSELKKFRHEIVNDGMFGNRLGYLGLGSGKVKFDYGFKTFSFALAVDDAEANYLAEMLEKRFGH